MTRGYVCITKGKAIESVAYLSSDAYLSWYGIRILKAVENGTLNVFIEDTYHDNIACYGKNDDPCNGFELNWIVPNKETKSDPSWTYSEYGYVYSLSTKKLKVYHCGKLLFTVTPDEYEKYKYIFNNDNEIYLGMSYDGQKLACIIDYDTCMRKAAKMDINELKEYVRKCGEGLVFLEDYHCIAPGHRPGHETYQKGLKMSGRTSLYFIVSNNGFGSKPWCVYLQTPFCRQPILGLGYASERSAMKALRELIQHVGPEKMFRTAEMMEAYEAARADETMKDFLLKIDEEWSKNPWYTPGGIFSPDSIRRSLH